MMKLLLFLGLAFSGDVLENAIRIDTDDTPPYWCLTVQSDYKAAAACDGRPVCYSSETFVFNQIDKVITITGCTLFKEGFE